VLLNRAGKFTADPPKSHVNTNKNGKPRGQDLLGPRARTLNLKAIIYTQGQDSKAITYTRIARRKYSEAYRYQFAVPVVPKPAG
jgi:hypothetical protein